MPGLSRPPSDGPTGALLPATQPRRTSPEGPPQDMRSRPGPRRVARSASDPTSWGPSRAAGTAGPAPCPQGVPGSARTLPASVPPGSGVQPWALPQGHTGNVVSMSRACKGGGQSGAPAVLPPGLLLWPGRWEGGGSVWGDDSPPGGLPAPTLACGLHTSSGAREGPRVRQGPQSVSVCQPGWLSPQDQSG